MDYKSENLTADFESVWKVSVTNFPDMAASYQAANQAVHTTHHSTDDNAEFFPKWADLRDEFQVILGNCANNLDDTAAALREVMNDFAEEDAEAAAALDAAQEDLPSEAEPMPDTMVPWSRRDEGSGQDYTDLPSCPDSTYESSAPTVAELKEKAETTDEKLLEAERTELGAVEGLIAWVIPNSFVESVASDMGHESVTAMMDNLAKSEPSWYEHAVGSLQGIGDLGSSPFSQFQTEVNNAKDALHTDKWGGDAASAFRENFLNAYEDIADNQVQLLGTLLGAVEGYQEALEDTYRTYDEVMDATITACDSIIDGGSGDLVSMATAALSAVITIAGTVATSGGATALKFALAGSGVSVGSAALSVGGNNTDDLWTNIRESFETADDALTELDTELAGALESDLAAVEEERAADGGKIELPRPAFADDPGKF